MKKKNYTGPVTEFVALKPIYNLMDLTITGSQADSSDAFVEEEEHPGSWSEIWTEE